jgi:hypothetical protein
VVTVCFTYLFGLKNNWAHALKVAALTLVICSIHFTSGSLEYPFAGQGWVQPAAFEEVLRSFQEYRGARAWANHPRVPVRIPHGFR